jgi:hypothetical protein
MATLPVKAVTVKAGTAGTVGAALGPGAEGGKEAGGTHLLDGVDGPAHERVGSNPRARREPAKLVNFIVRTTSKRTIADTPTDQRFNNLAATVGA